MYCSWETPELLHFEHWVCTAGDAPRHRWLLHAYPVCVQRFDERRQVLLIASGVTGARTLQALVRSARTEQRQLCHDVATMQRDACKSSKKVAVDRVFLRRLGTILRM